MEGSFEIKVVGGLGFETVPEIDKNYTKTNHLEHLGSLGRKGFEMILKLILWSIRAASGLGPEMVPKQTAGFTEQHPPSAWGLFKQHPPMLWGLPALFKQHSPRVWSLPGLVKQHRPRVWGLPALSKRHPTKTWCPMVATTGTEWLDRPLSNPLRQICATI